MRNHKPLPSFRLLPLASQLPEPNIHQKHDLAQIEQQRDSVEEIAVCRTGVDPEVIEDGAEDGAPDEEGRDEEAYFRDCLKDASACADVAC